MSLEQMKEFMQYIPYEKKEELKENFYKEKIQEAIEKKVKPIIYNDKKYVFIFRWNELPLEVEKKILEFKYEIDMLWIPTHLSVNKFTIKSMESWWFSQDIKYCPCLSRGKWYQFWANILNEKDLNEGESKLVNESMKKIYEKYIDQGGKIPSMFEYVEHRNKEQEKLKKTQDEIYGQYKVGDMFYNSRDEIVLRIIGETKTQYRVEEYTGVVIDESFNRYTCKIDTLSLSLYGNWTKRKNITKKDICIKYHKVEPNGVDYIDDGSED